MISWARLKANRANARRSTGPKTQAGKQRSAMNAKKHGFRSKNLTPFLNEQDRQAFLDEALASTRGSASVSARRIIFETQAALRSIDASWDEQMAHLHAQTDKRVDHEASTLELNRLSLYAQRLRSLQRKAIDHYLNQGEYDKDLQAAARSGDGRVSAARSETPDQKRK